MLKALFDIRPPEKYPILILFSMFFCIVFSSITGSAMKDAIFLIHYEKTYLPIMYLFVAFVMIVFIKIYNETSEGKNQLSLLKITGAIFSLSLLVIQFFLNGIIIPFFYIWIEIVTIFSVMQFWIVAGEIFNARQAKRLFPLIIAGGSLAAILSGYSIKPFLTYFSSHNLIYLTIGFLLTNIFMAMFLNPYLSTNEVVTTEPMVGFNINNIRKDPYLVSIGIMIALSAIISRIIDYQFKIVAASTFPDQEALVSFFGTYYGLSGFATLLMQLSVTGFILKKLGILLGLLILPISLAIGSLGFLYSGTLIMIFIAKFSDQVFKFSINNSIKELLWLPISAKKKLQTKPIIDGVLRSGMEGLSGLIIFLLVMLSILPQSQIHFLSILVLIGIIAWVWNSFGLVKGYISSIMNSIENRRLNLDEIKFSINDSNTTETLEKALLEKNELRQLFAIDLLWKLPLTPWKDTLEYLFDKGPLTIQRAILELTWQKQDIISNQLVMDKIKKENNLSPHALLCANDRGIKELISTYSNFSKHKNKSIMVAYHVTVLSKNMENLKSKREVEKIHTSGNEEYQIELINFLKRYPQLLSPKHITNYLKNGTTNIKNDILSFLARNPSSSYFENIFVLLEKPETIMSATKALLEINHYDAYFEMAKAISSPKVNIKSKKLSLRLLPKFINNQPVDFLFENLNSSHLSLVNETSDALIGISKKQILSNNHFDLIQKSITSLAHRAFQLHLFKSTIDNESSSSLIKDHIDYDLSILIPVLLKLGTLKEPKIPIEKYIGYVESDDKELLPYVLELVDSTFSATSKKFILPLIDPDVRPSKIAIGLFDTKFLSKNEILQSWIQSNHPWKKSVALNYCLRNEKIDILKKIEWKTENEDYVDHKVYALLNDSEKKYLNRNFLNNKILIEETPVMYSILEKTILLKSVDLFQNIPGNVLSKISQITSEIHLEDKDIIFNEGEPGDSLFVIISGGVEIIKDNHTIAVLEQGSCMGEMSLLDHEPRSAKAITNGETILLKIEQRGFFELMAGNSEIMKQIVKLLTKRLRQTNQKLTDSEK